MKKISLILGAFIVISSISVFAQTGHIGSSSAQATLNSNLPSPSEEDISRVMKNFTGFDKLGYVTALGPAEPSQIYDNKSLKWVSNGLKVLATQPYSIGVITSQSDHAPILPGQSDFNRTILASDNFLVLHTLGSGNPTYFLIKESGINPLDIKLVSDNVIELGGVPYYERTLGCNGGSTIYRKLRIEIYLEKKDRKYVPAAKYINISDEKRCNRFSANQ